MLERFAPMASTAAPRDPAATPGIAVPTEVTLGAIGAAAIVWGGAFVRGRLKQDAQEKIEMAEAVKKADAALDSLGVTVAALQVAVAKCEAHREHDGENMRRMSAELAEVKRRQSERIGREHDHE